MQKVLLFALFLEPLPVIPTTILCTVSYIQKTDNLQISTDQIWNKVIENFVIKNHNIVIWVNIL